MFDCVPACGNIEPGNSQEIAVTFTADHPSDCYADELSIEVNNDVSETVRLRARASSTLMYLQGWDELQPNEESLSEIIPEREEGRRLEIITCFRLLKTGCNIVVRTALFLSFQQLIIRSEASPTICSCYANLNHYHYSFLQKLIPFIVYKHRKICIA